MTHEVQAVALNLELESIPDLYHDVVDIIDHLAPHEIRTLFVSAKNARAALEVIESALEWRLLLAETTGQREFWTRWRVTHAVALVSERRHPPTRRDWLAEANPVVSCERVEVPVE